MARFLHIKLQVCAQKGGTMLEQMNAERQSEAKDLAHAQDASASPKYSGSAMFVELRDTLPSHVDLVSPFVDQLMRFISRFRVADENNVDIEVALREALVNAMVHGNQEDAHKRVYVKCRCTADGEVSIRVEDEGHGFNNCDVPDPTSSNNLLSTHGRGIYLMRTLMDEIDFEQGGSVVHMRKRAKSGGRVQ
jgi:serine/threonine-protein kinase RsbW